MGQNDVETSIEQKFDNEKSENCGYLPSLSVIVERSESNDESLWSIEDALKVIGFGKVQIELVIVVGLILIAVLNETMGVAFILPAAQCDLNLTTSDKGFLSSMTFLGMMFSSYFWGFLGDTQGRRVVMIWSLFFSLVSTLTSVFIKSFAVFAFFRFLTGVFVAGYSATAYAYLGEFNTSKHQAFLISFVSASIGIAAIYQPLSAMWILSYDFSFELYEGYLFRPWRLCLIVYALPGIVSALWLLKLHESPKFLISQNRTDDALKVIRWMLLRNKGRTITPNINKLKSENAEIAGKNYKGMKALMMSLVNQTFPLFKPPYLLYFSVCSLLHFGTFSVAGGMAIFLPDILNKLSTSENMAICEMINMKMPDENLADQNEVCNDSIDSSVFLDSVFIGLGYFFGFIVISAALKKFGRRNIFIFTLSIAGISGFLLTVVKVHFVIVILYCSFILFTGLNVSVINGAACDLFPTHLRAMAVCVAMMMGRFGSVVSANLIGFVIEKNCQLTYYTFASLTFVCLAVSFLIPKEPKTLENIK